jgi:hypothetical protein
MDFYYSRPFGSHRLVTCLSKRKFEFCNNTEARLARNEIMHIKWDNGTSNRYHMCPAYYRCRFRAYRNVDEYRE